MKPGELKPAQCRILAYAEAVHGTGVSCGAGVMRGMESQATFMEQVHDLANRESLSFEIARKDRPTRSVEAITQRHKFRDSARQ